ncbi:MAG: asparaginase [Planctomycetaceae bacterium]|nr:asparaginase [Planctomycetaceae bacterium]
MNSPALRVLVTGGTFDKNYNELEGRLHFRETHVPEMLELGRARLDVTVETLMLIDSLEMTDEHRAQVLEACRRAPENHIVVTHGTDTMELTARTLGAANLPKTIVITGAMVPYTFGSSDGLFNLGSALAFAQSLPPGTYVAMNGRVLTWEHVRKNRATGVFEETTL